MPLTASGRNRPQWYDRTPTGVVRDYRVDAVAPHVATERWRYTVPANRKAMVELVAARVVRSVAAAPAGLVRCWITINIGGVGTEPLHARLYTNAIGDNSNQTNSGTIVLVAGDFIAGSTADSSTGGNVDYFLELKATEFDA